MAKVFSLTENVKDGDLLVVPIHLATNKEGSLVMGASFYKRLKDRLISARTEKPIDKVLGENLSLKTPYVMVRVKDTKTDRTFRLLAVACKEPFLKNPPEERILPNLREKFKGKQYVPGWALTPDAQLFNKSLNRAVPFTLKKLNEVGNVFAYVPDEGLLPLLKEKLSELEGKTVVLFNDKEILEKFTPQVRAETPEEAIKQALKKLLLRAVKVTESMTPIPFSDLYSGRFTLDFLALSNEVATTYGMSGVVVEKDGTYKAYLSAQREGKDLVYSPLWREYKGGKPVKQVEVVVDVYSDQTSAFYTIKDLKFPEVEEKNFSLLKEGYSLFREITGKDDFYSYGLLFRYGEVEEKVSVLRKVKAIKDTLGEFLSVKVHYGLVVGELNSLKEAEVFLTGMDKASNSITISGVIGERGIALFVPKKQKVEKPTLFFKATIGKNALIQVRTVPKRLIPKVEKTVNLFLAEFERTKDVSKARAVALNKDSGQKVMQLSLF